MFNQNLQLSIGDHSPPLASAFIVVAILEATSEPSKGKKRLKVLAGCTDSSIINESVVGSRFFLSLLHGHKLIKST